MSVVHVPTRRILVTNSPLTRQDSVADVMTINRLEEILSVLHANDNELLKKQGEPGYDRLHKVRPLLTIISGLWISRLPEFVGSKYLKEMRCTLAWTTELEQWKQNLHSVRKSKPLLLICNNLQPFSHSCLEPMHPLTPTQWPILSAKVILQCWKLWRSETFWGCLTGWERRVSQADLTVVLKQFFAALYRQPDYGEFYICIIKMAETLDGRLADVIADALLQMMKHWMAE